MKNILSDIRNFVQGNFRFLYHEHNAPHINEQAEWRAFKCQDCLKAGKCRHCGCKTPNMFYAPNKIDSAGKWGRMLSQVEWEQFKKSDGEYILFEQALKQNNKQENASTELYRQQQELLGYTPPLSDPLPEYYQRTGQEEVLGSPVDNSTDPSSELTILQSTIRREEDSSDKGTPGIGHGIRPVQLSGDYIPRPDTDSGAEASPSLEEEDGGKEQTN